MMSSECSLSRHSVSYYYYHVPTYWSCWGKVCIKVPYRLATNNLSIIENILRSIGYLAYHQPIEWKGTWTWPVGRVSPSIKYSTVLWVLAEWFICFVDRIDSFHRPWPKTVYSKATRNYLFNVNGIIFFCCCCSSCLLGQEHDIIFYVHICTFLTPSLSLCPSNAVLRTWNSKYYVSPVVWVDGVLWLELDTGEDDNISLQSGFHKHDTTSL